MESIEEMRAVCVAHYVERRHTPAHADLIIPKDEKEIRRIYKCIQEEQERGYFEYPTAFPFLLDEETAAEQAAVFLIPKRRGAREQKFLDEVD